MLCSHRCVLYYGDLNFPLLDKELAFICFCVYVYVNPNMHALFVREMDICLPSVSLLTCMYASLTVGL